MQFSPKPLPWERATRFKLYRLTACCVTQKALHLQGFFIGLEQGQGKVWNLVKNFDEALDIKKY